MKKLKYPLFLLCCILFNTAQAQPVSGDIRIVKPSNKATGVSVNLTIKTQHVPGALNYTVELNESLSFAGTSLVQISSDSVFHFNDLKYLTKYYARAKTDISSGYGTVSSFTTRSSEGYTFINYPYNGLTNVRTTNLTVSANLVPGAKRYTIELSNNIYFDPDGGELLTKTSEVDYQRTLLFPTLSYGTTYYARVTTEIWADAGRVTSFTTRIEPYSAMVKPNNGKTGNDFAYLEIIASPVSGSKHYTVEINTKSNFTGVSIVRTSTNDYQRSFIFTDLLPSTNYFVRVKPDVYNEYGPTRKFSTRPSIKQHRLWGVTAHDGTHNSGTIFSYSIDSSRATVHYNNTGHYDHLHGSIVRSGDGGFFTSSATDGDASDGSVLKLNANGTVTSIEGTFGDLGDIIQASDGYVYQTSYMVNGLTGGILKIDPDRPYDYFKDGLHLDFDTLTGVNPSAGLLEYTDGFFYGTTISTIFKVNHDGSDFQKVFDFSTATTQWPSGKLLDGDDGYLYGSTAVGGASGFGTIYKIAPDGNDFHVLHNFTGGSDGASPKGELILTNNTLFGMTSLGGDSTFGTIFRIHRDGTGYEKLFQFDGENGRAPLGGLVTDGKGALYGMTSMGNIYIDYENYNYGTGVVFTIKTDGTNFRKLLDIGGSDGGTDGMLLYLEDDWQHFTPSSARSKTEELSEVTEVAPVKHFTVYPNPFDHTLNIEINTPEEEDYTVAVMDVRGEVVDQAKGVTNRITQIENNLASGLYIIKISSGKDVSIHRVNKK